MAALRALAAQAIGAATALAVIGLWPPALDAPLALAFGQALVAALASVALRSENWWLPIHLAFAPALVATSRLALAPGWFLAGFVLLALIYWSSFRSRVPLYLSNRSTAAAVAALLPRREGLRVVDLGAGTGGLLRRLARARPDARFTGIEHAPLPVLLAWLSARGLANCAMERDDFWRRSLAGCDVAYAFLSPVPMPRLWQKAKAEMRAGSLLVSNSFPVPGVEPQRVVEVDDRRGTRLYCYVL